MNIKSPQLKFLSISLLTLFSLSTAIAQKLPSVSQLQSMSSEQLQDYWKKAQEQGYSIEQVEQMARLRGVSEADIQELKQKLQSVGATTTTIEKKQSDTAQTSFGFIPNQENEIDQTLE
jgi:ABC-type taurine transport system substrate-binding protein